MNWREIFNRRAATRTEQTLGGDEGGAPREGVFVTPQSLASFPGAAAAAYAVWSALGTLGDESSFFATQTCAFLVAAFFGLLITFIAMSDPQRAAATPRDKLIQIAVGMINTVLLYITMLGVDG